jgi:hypothetical protein
MRPILLSVIFALGCSLHPVAQFDDILKKAGTRPV